MECINDNLASTGTPWKVVGHTTLHFGINFKDKNKENFCLNYETLNKMNL